MLFSGPVARAMPLISALVLTACGGNGAPGPVGNPPGTGPGEPPPVELSSGAFVAKAKAEPCGDFRNKLYVIDNKMVLHDRAGNCPDNGNVQVLYGATVDTILCQSADGIAGTIISCQDATKRPLFDTMRANLNKADLGLGAGHSVKPVEFLAQNGNPPAGVAFGTIAAGAYSWRAGAAANLVIKDPGAWLALWTQHTDMPVAVGAAPLPRPALPAVDFERDMVLAVFMGGFGSGCYGIGVQSIARLDAKLQVNVLRTEPGPGAICTMAITSPFHLAVLPRSELPVEFVTQTRFIP